jgi:hypothetical protein
MNMTKLLRCIGILFFSFSVSAQADTPANTNSDTSVADKPATDSVQPAPPSITPSPVQATLADHQVPKISLRWDCGECKHNEKVFPLLTENYRDEAIAKGYSVSETETAEVAITQFRQRPPGLRVMFGAFAGRDKLSTRITFRGKEYVVEDYEANAFIGMNGLCLSIAQKAFKQISAAVESK